MASLHAAAVEPTGFRQLFPSLLRLWRRGAFLAIAALQKAGGCRSAAALRTSGVSTASIRVLSVGHRKGRMGRSPKQTKEN